jgi:hypothetical protein
MKIKFATATLALALTASVPAFAQPRAVPLVQAGVGAPQPGGSAAAAEVDHQRIIALLTNLTNQVAALSQQEAQTQDALKALQISMGLTLTSTDKGRVAAINDGIAVSNLQANISSMQADIGYLKTNVAAIQSNLASMQTNAAASQTLQTDMARRLYITCYMTAYGFVSASGSRPYDKTSCTSGGWNVKEFNFDTPFTTVYTPPPAVGGAPVPPKH